MKKLLVLSIMFFSILSAIPAEESGQGDLDKYLKGAAGYCARLKGEAFHFFCKENVVLKKDKLLSSIGHSNKLNRQRFNIKYLFDYQIISKGKRVEEQRKLLSQSGGDKNYDPREILVFLNEKVVFAPTSILDRERQSDFNFKLSEGNMEESSNIVIIEAIPKIKGARFFSSSEIYLDKESYAIRKIIAIPRFIKGYEVMKKIAGIYKTKLFLNVEVNFDKEYKGLYFPTKIVITEKYRGGPQIPRYVGPLGWVRTETIFNYTDYRFFDVDTEVKVEK
ncbi:MAG: hypothetical protein KAR14_04850 [Candidatus Aminicenantes bacterium]|nr:hypothetical protein [Candidatus Aminicenantes bacterium]